MASRSNVGFDKLSVIRALDQMLWPTTLLAARLVAKIPRRRTESPVIIRPGGMGDLICVHMAMEHLGIDPQSYTWVVETRSMPWVSLMDLPHRIISPRLALAVAKYRHVVNSEQHYGASQIIAIAMAGRGRNVTSLSTVRGSYTATNIVPYSPIRTHEMKSFVNLLRAAHNLDDDGRDIARTRTTANTGQLVVALGGGHAESRSLDVDQWEEVIKKWTDGKDFVMIAGPVETPMAQELEHRFGGRAVLRTGNFGENCGVIAGAHRVLTMDGGLTHVASYHGVPTDTLFTSGQDDLWAPLAKGSRVFADRSIECRPCTMFGFTPRCPVGHLCKAHLPGEVLPAV